ncbi:MAG: hypothetical protein JRJ47_15110 [Deltaproteobacteria bacterium]|nr:hypothetical protein [Deltaproteobacteria bacterium]
MEGRYKQKILSTLHLSRLGSEWDLKYGDIALPWRGGCIIRAAFLERIKDAFDRNPNLENLMLDPSRPQIKA